MPYKIFERVKGQSRFQQYDFVSYRTRKNAQVSLKHDVFAKKAKRKFGLTFEIRPVIKRRMR